MFKRTMGSQRVALFLMLTVCSGFAHAGLSDCPKIHWYSQGSPKTFADNPGADYFSNNKETVIFVHGFQSSPSTEFDIVPTPVYDDATWSYSADSWEFEYKEMKESGNHNFNFGILLWNSAIAGGSTTETRIWNWNQTFSCSGQPKNLLDVFRDEFESVRDRSGYTQKIHLVAHSMGTQLLLSFLKRAHTASGSNGYGYDSPDDYPATAVLLEPGWTFLSSKIGTTSDALEDLVSPTVGEAIPTAVVMGKSYRFGDWGMFNYDDEERNEAYITMSELVFDFWWPVNPSAYGPSNSNRYKGQHREIIKYWFEWLPDVLFSNYDGTYQSAETHFPYAMFLQWGPEVTPLWFFYKGRFYFYGYIYHWYNRVQEALNEPGWNGPGTGGKVMMPFLDSFVWKYKACSLIDDSSDSYYGAPDGDDCE